MFVKPRNLPRPPPVLMVSDKPAEIVDEFTYLGSILSNHKSILKDLMHRISKASAVVGRLSKLRRKPSISRRTKMRIYKMRKITALKDYIEGTILLATRTSWR